MQTLAERIVRPFLILLLLALTPTLAHALGQDVFEKVREQGVLRCGVSKSIPGLALQAPGGEWAGTDVDFCKALAAAVLGSPDRIRLVPLSAVERFPALLAARVDLIAGGTTWTLARELGLKVSFVGPLMFSAQRVMVRADSGISSLSQLSGESICLVRSTTHEEHLRGLFEVQGWKPKLLLKNSYVESRAAFESGQCRALSGDEVALASMKPADDGSSPYRLLPDVISNEPLSAVIAGNNPNWERVVRWVLFMLIAAESNGMDQRAAATLQPGSRADALAAQARRYGPALGLDPAWAERAVAAVGNYGEIFERNLGSGSAIKLSRGVNRPANQGGMLYAPPLH